MAEDLFIHKGTKKEQYGSLLLQLQALLKEESDLIACMSTVSAALKAQFNFFWVGFYIIKENELVLGPFQGPIACMRIKKGKGVCGTSWEKAETIIVPDVDAFPGHIACNSLSKSEIVVPLLFDGLVRGILDVDSKVVNDFDQEDAYHLEQIGKLLPLNGND